jgi:hypothetical protein
MSSTSDPPLELTFGLRMPARRDLSTRSEGRRPKASQEGTRGGWLVGLPSMGI